MNIGFYKKYCKVFDEIEKKVVLQRDCSDGGYKEQITIDGNRNLFYRRTIPSVIDEYEDWQAWENETKALFFVFGSIKLTTKLISEFKKCLLNQIELKEDEFNMKNY